MFLQPLGLSAFCIWYLHSIKSQKAIHFLEIWNGTVLTCIPIICCPLLSVPFLQSFCLVVEYLTCCLIHWITWCDGSTNFGCYINLSWLFLKLTGLFLKGFMLEMMPISLLYVRKMKETELETYFLESKWNPYNCSVGFSGPVDHRYRHGSHFCFRKYFCIFIDCQHDIPYSLL